MSADYRKKQQDSVAPEFVWTEALSVADTGIDADHRHIFELVNRLLAAIREGADASIVGEVLRELNAYAKEHFRREEDYMAAIAFAGRADHMLEHSLLLAGVNRLQQQFSLEQRDLRDELLGFLQKWLVNHIMNSDVELACSADPTSRRATNGRRLSQPGGNDDCA